MVGGDRLRRALIVCLALAPPAGLGPLQAQTTGAIEGALTDHRGGALAGATVTVANVETGAGRTVVADRRGFYKVKGLASGTYTLWAGHKGFRTLVKPGIRVRAGREISVVLRLEPGETSRTITLTGGSPPIASTGSGVVFPVDEEAFAELPVSGRDYADFAVLAPTVLRADPGALLTIGGQRESDSGLTIDGADAKSAFFGYGRGGEAAANGGLVVAPGSVEDLQVVVGDFAPERGASGGAYLSVITKAGGNEIAGSAFFHIRDEGLASDLDRSPLDRFLGRTGPAATGPFTRDNYGASIGGPFRKSRTHWFLSFDRVDRSEPFTRSIDARGLYDAILVRARTDPRFLALVGGFAPRDDGVAAPDPVSGRTASGRFNREVDNEILLGRLDHRIHDAHSLSGRLHLTEYARLSSFADEESRKLEETLSLVLQSVSVLGPDKLNELGLQLAEDDLDRLSTRVGQGIEAEIDYDARGADLGNAPAIVGKTDFLPIRAAESKLQVQDGFSYLLGSHDTKFGLDYERDDLKHLFAGRRDGEYHFDTLEDFIDNDADFVDIFFGDVTFPNYEATREVYGLYAQDSWRPGASLSIRYGLRYGATRNPDGLEHLFPQGRNIADDTDNVAPRFSFAWTPGGKARSVVRGGAGLFFGRTPNLIFASQVRENGLFPNAGEVRVRPGDVGYAPLGENIDNKNPPPGAAVAAGFVDPGFEDAEILRIHFGYERELAPDWSGGVDLIWADGENLLETVDINRTFTTDSGGRPIYSPDRPLSRGDVTGQADDTPLAEVLTRQSIGESEYRALTLHVRKRFSGRYQLQAHYTFAEDKDTSSDERSVSRVTLLRPDDPRYDFGFADRDVQSRLVVSGLVELPWDFTVSGVYEYRSGTPFNPVDREADLVNCGHAALDFNCPDVRPIGPDGRVLGRNSFRNESFDRLDLRVAKFFELGERYRADLFFEIFNVFDDAAFTVDPSADGDRQRDPADPQFGLASQRVLTNREMQVGVRFSF